MAIAIDLWLEVEAEVADPPSWDFEGEGAQYLAAHENPFTRRSSAKRTTLLEHALRDRIHQPHRLHLYPWTQDVIDAAEKSGAYGAAICGAGPSVFAFCASSQAFRVSRAMAGAAPHHGKPMVTRVTDKGMFRTL